MAPKRTLGRYGHKIGTNCSGSSIRVNAPHISHRVCTAVAMSEGSAQSNRSKDQCRFIHRHTSTLCMVDRCHIFQLGMHSMYQNEIKKMGS